MRFSAQRLVALVCVLLGLLILWRTYAPGTAPEVAIVPPSGALEDGTALELTPIAVTTLEIARETSAAASTTGDTLSDADTPAVSDAPPTLIGVAPLPTAADVAIPQPVPIVTARPGVPTPVPANPEPVIVAPPPAAGSGNSNGNGATGNGGSANDGAGSGGDTAPSATALVSVTATILVTPTVTLTPTATLTPTPTPTPTQVTFAVVLRVEGTTPQVSILYSTPDDSERLDDVTLPWTLTFRLPSGARVQILADNSSDRGDVTCQVLIDDVVIASVNDPIAFGEVQCDVVVP